jgi:hypothetical protein
MSKSKSNWSVQFGSVKSLDMSAAIFKPKVKKNPYIRGARYRKLEGVNHKTMTNSEAY